MVSTGGSRLARAAVAVALLLVTLTYAVTRVFVLNFSTAGPNATALLSLLLVTGWTLPLAARVDDAAREPVLVAVAAGGVAVSVLGGPVVALLGAALAGLVLTPLLARDATRLGERTGVAFGLGLLLVLALRGVTGAVSAYATPVGLGALVALLLGLSAATLALRLDDTAPPDGVVRLAPLFVAVFLAALWLGYPTVTARWAGRPYLPTVALSAVGLLAGSLWVASVGAPGGRGALAWGLFLVGATARVLSAEALPFVGLPLATGTLVVLASTGGTGRWGPRRAGVAVTAAQLAGLVLVVAFVLAVNWAFVPGVGPLLRGLESTLVLALAALVGVTAALTVRGRPDPASPTGLDGTRRALVGGVGAGVVALAGTLLRAPRPRSSDGAGRLAVATYNVHQFFDADGGYNLRAVADVLGRQEYGIVGLQETEGARVTSGNVHGVRWLAAALGYNYHPGPDTAVGGYGVALLSKWPIDEAEVVELPTDGTVSRPALRATVDHPDGPLPVVVAHLEVDGEVRVRQARRVTELVENAARTVVLGDFNATPDEDVYSVMTESFTDAWVAGAGDGYTYSASRPRERIDYVFVRGFEPTDATVFGGPGESDHRGVGASLARE